MMLRSLILLVCFMTVALCSATTNYAAQQANPSDVPALKNVAPDQVDSVLARLSDEQVRNLLIAELAKDVPAQNKSTTGGKGLFTVAVNWLHLFDLENGQEMENRLQRIVDHAGYVPADLKATFLGFGDGRTVGSVLKNISILLLILAAAFGIEFVVRKLTASIRRDFVREDIPELNGCTRLWAGAIRQIPVFVDLAIFAGTSLLLFALTPFMDAQGMRHLFLAVLFPILFFRAGLLLSHLFFSPNLAFLRLLPVSDTAAATFHNLALFFFIYVGTGMSFLALMAESGIPHESLVLLIITIGSILLLSTAVILVQNRQQIANYISSTETVDTGTNWVMDKFASLWHVPALLYLFIVWIVFLFQQALGVRQDEGAFLLSLLALPLFLLLDRIGNWVVTMTISTLKIYKDNEEQPNEGNPDELTVEQKERLLNIKVMRIVRLIILLALVGWAMTLWGYNLPYVATITKIVFRSLVTLALALAFWKVLSGYIERKITEDEPEEEQDEQDDEWGGAAQRGRSYTLLPLVRKFIGSVLVVMVTLIILSTIGIEIGPLLAGAGVIGLAIGFGAQKLVSDIFSGFFYLLDDAFRVGEYMEAGGVSGAVENITLRNVMLRHHRGMLQIVPYSELGPITNFMRGGIVVKFNLEFPYDTDIDKVRKIIKKVGQAMLEDEELGGDFIQPVKSQGVREITNSVMVIRVKFTAKPGTHFVIRREAYRRITEALADKGIHYAHRKVIVEVPGTAADTDKQKIAEAGAAAGMAANAEDEKNNPSNTG